MLARCGQWAGLALQNHTLRAHCWVLTDLRVLPGKRGQKLVGEKQEAWSHFEARAMKT